MSLTMMMMMMMRMMMMMMMRRRRRRMLQLGPEHLARAPLVRICHQRVPFLPPGSHLLGVEDGAEARAEDGHQDPLL